jgi:hypothetical protein
MTLHLVNGTQAINIYNVYSPPPTNYNDEINIILIITLNSALTMPGRYIIVKDFNLHYLWWGEAAYAH